LGKYEHFLPAFDAAARTVPASTKIINCTPGSALRSFPMSTLDEALHPLDVRRKAEHAKYERAYTESEYGMGERRMADTLSDLKALPRGSLLDVGCGRGEVLDQAAQMGFAPVHGVEVVQSLTDGKRVVFGEVHALPFSSSAFDVATMFDVIEHLIPGDDELACKELARVARKHVLITANNETSQRAIGEELHINRRAYDEWDALFRRWFPGSVTRMAGERQHPSQGWRVDL
jgi:ubiquinone/menaquinone biosynthesis C-methylase UbiE